MSNYYKANKWSKPNTYAVKHKDLSTRMASRSGGFFTAITDNILSEHGVVYGCILDNDLKAIHIRTENIEGRNKMRGSKYVQSDMLDVFYNVKKDLDDGKIVLFSGTSCQISGLYGYLEKDYNNLITVDIVCHGVPSPMIWREYLDWIEKKTGSKAISADFRNKKDYGWRAHRELIICEDESRFDKNIYATLMYGHSILRPCCAKCPYKDLIHPANITLADYWGIDVILPGFSDNKGVSLVLVNDDKGQYYFEKVKNDTIWEQTKPEDLKHSTLRAPYDNPQNRSEVWKDIYTKKFDWIAYKYGGDDLFNKVKRKLKHLFNK